MQVKPRVYSLQPGIDEEDHISFFSSVLMRPLMLSFVEKVELEADTNEVVEAYRFEVLDYGLQKARMAFNCESVYEPMAQAGILNRGTDCGLHQGMFDLSAINNHIPYVWSLPHYYLVQSPDPTQHPRNNLEGFVTPTGPRYRSMVVIEPESGKVLQSMIKDQISIRLYRDDANYFFTQHKRVIIPLYWMFDTRNTTVAERSLLASFQSSFSGLNAGFIACVVLAAVSLIGALFLGMLLYRDNSLHSVEEKRKRIQAELASAQPPDQGETEHMRVDFD